MIGVLDSGAGGITAVRELRKLLPYADVLFLPDRKNAPYGTKTKKELIPLVERDMEILLSRGADTVLMACCTASTVYHFITEKYRRVAIPIIEPTAKAAARATENGCVAVIATAATVRSGEFSRRLAALGVNTACEIPAGDLVHFVEGGARDGRITKGCCEALDRYSEKILSSGADTLILGCTHFPHLAEEIAKRLPRVKLISSSFEGAKETVKHSHLREGGKTVYMTTK